MIRRISKKLLWMDDESEEEPQTEEAKYKLDTKDPTIYKEHYPKQDYGSTITLRDERKLGYMIYGALQDYKATIILLPGSPGTRLLNHETHAAINVLYGIRLIVIDRPGIGLSSKHDVYTFKSHAHDIYELVQQLQIHTYHIAAYSAGGPFGCAYCGLYSNPNSTFHLKSYHLISGVGPSDTPSAYGQMTMLNKFGWFVVKNSSKNVIHFVANQSAKSHKKTPITGLVKDFSDSPHDEYMIKDPKVIRSLLTSKYEIESMETGQESANRLLVLYGMPWEVALEDIKCPLCIYNGTLDYSCVPNMAKYIFERISGTKAPHPPLKKKKQDASNEEDGNCGSSSEVETDDDWEDEECKHANDVSTETRDDDDAGHKPTSKVAVYITEDDDDETQTYDSIKVGTMSVSRKVMNKLEHEYNENEKQHNVKNKQCSLIWGSEKGHLWFFEEDLWREVVCRVLFLENKE